MKIFIISEKIKFELNVLNIPEKFYDLMRSLNYLTVVILYLLYNTDLSIYY